MFILYCLIVPAGYRGSPHVILNVIELCFATTVRLTTALETRQIKSHYITNNICIYLMNNVKLKKSFCVIENAFPWYALCTIRWF